MTKLMKALRNKHYDSFCTAGPFSLSYPLEKISSCLSFGKSDQSRHTKCG